MGSGYDEVCPGLYVITCSLSRMVAVSILLMFLLCTVVQQSPLSPAARGSSPSPVESAVLGHDYALSFGGKVKGLRLKRDKGTNVVFEENTVVQQSPLSPAVRESPTEGVYLVIGPLSRKSKF